MILFATGIKKVMAIPSHITPKSGSFAFHTYWESLDFCPSPELLIFSDYGLHTTKIISCEVSDDVGVVQYGRQPGQGFSPRWRAV